MVRFVEDLHSRFALHRIAMAKPNKRRNGWRIRWFNEHGQRQSLTLGSYAEAQKELCRRTAEVDDILRGARLGLIPNQTFHDLAEYWVKHRAPLKRSGDFDKSILRAHMYPAFKELKLVEITTAVIDRYRLERVHLSPKTIHNHLTLLVSMLNLAVELQWLARVPRIKKPKVQIVDKNFRYLRGDSEVRALLTEARTKSELAYVLYATAIYTGMRQGELAGLIWADIDFDRRIICVARSFDGPTKNGETRYVPILDPLLPVLREWRLQCPGRLVFPTSAGTMHAGCARIFREKFGAVVRAAGFSDVERRGGTRPYITFHDLRHTFASLWVMREGDLFKLQKILGHKTVQMTMRYAHLAPQAFASDHARLGGAAPLSASAVTPIKSSPVQPSLVSITDHVGASITNYGGSNERQSTDVRSSREDVGMPHRDALRVGSSQANPACQAK